jgi:uncharacterized repeat protein (TIGR01451 family)
VPEGGGDVAYSFTVTNTADPNDPGSQDFVNVELFDDHLGIVVNEPLAVGQTITYDHPPVWITERTDNKVTATGYTEEFDYCIDETIVSVVKDSEADLEVTKDYEIVCEPVCGCGCKDSNGGERDIDCYDPPEEECYLEYTITAINHGPNGPVLGVEVVDVLPDELTYLDHTTSAGSFDPNSGLWDGFDLPAGEFETLTIRVETVDDSNGNNIVETQQLPGVSTGIDQYLTGGNGKNCKPNECEYKCGKIVNTATISAPNSIFVDPNPDNNSDSVSIPYGNCSVVMIEQLKVKIQKLAEGGKIPEYKATKLIKLLDYALKYLGYCKTRYAIYKMNLFIRYVNRWDKYGILSADVANYLRTQGQLIIAEIRAG